jgi:transcriptional regulator with XRE-family HTH domain
MPDMARTADHAGSDGQSPKDIGRQLRDVRKKQGLSRAEVARSAGLTRRELASYERGRSEVPESDLWCLAGSCGVDVAELLPNRPPVKVSADLSMLAVGDSIRYLRSPVDDDELLREYLAMIYELRNLAPGSKVTLRERDLMSLADALGGTPEKIEQRLVDLIGMSRQEAARMREMILPLQALPAGDPPPTGDPYTDLAAPTESNDEFANPYSELAARGGDGGALSDENVHDFFSAPRADDPFEEPPPPPLSRPAVAAWENDLDASLLSPMEPMAGGPDPIDVELSNPLPHVEPEALPADPFAAPAPLMSDITDALNDDPTAEPFSAFSGDTFSTDASATGFVVDAPSTDYAIDERDLTIDESLSILRSDAPGDGFAVDAPADDFGIDTPVTDFDDDAPASFGETSFGETSFGETAFGETSIDDLVVDVDHTDDTWGGEPTDEPGTPEPVESGFGDLAPDALVEARGDGELAASLPEVDWVPAVEWAPEAEAVPHARGVGMDEISPIAWVARDEPAPEAQDGVVTGPQFERAGQNWRVGGIFPATATADDGALALRRADARWALADIEAPGDFTIEASVDFTAGAGFGVLFRASVDHTDRVSGYSFDVDPIAGGGGYLIRQWEDNRQHWRPLAQTSVTDPSALFGRHTISVTLRADQLTVTVDNEPVLSVAGLTRVSVELGRPPCRGEFVGIQAWATTEVTIDSFQVARY